MKLFKPVPYIPQVSRIRYIDPDEDEFVDEALMLYDNNKLIRCGYNQDDRVLYRVDIDGSWKVNKYDQVGRKTYYGDSNGYWQVGRYDAYGDIMSILDSNNVKHVHF